MPAIAVSAYTRAGTIIHDEMHHGAVIATLSRLHGLRPLTRRDDGANDLFSVVNLDAAARSARLADGAADVRAGQPDEDERIDLKHGAHQDKPLSPPGTRAARPAARQATAAATPRSRTTYADAYRILQAHGLGLFYPKIT